MQPNEHIDELSQEVKDDDRNNGIGKLFMMLGMTLALMSITSTPQGGLIAEAVQRL